MKVNSLKVAFYSDCFFFFLIIIVSLSFLKRLSIDAFCCPFFLNGLTQQKKKKNNWAAVFQFPSLLMTYYCPTKFIKIYIIWSEIPTIRLTPLSHTQERLCHQKVSVESTFPERTLELPGTFLLANEASLIYQISSFSFWGRKRA